MLRRFFYFNQMKYQRLSKEQFEALHEEFATFLATQSITADQWDLIKTKKPEIAEQELDLFSDMIWEGVLKSVEYLDHRSPQHLFLFKADETGLNVIVVEVNEESVDLQTTNGLAWLEKHIMQDDVKLYTSTKPYTTDRNDELFKIIQQGADISKGELFNSLKKLLS